jgi:hypothetical protein
VSAGLGPQWRSAAKRTHAADVATRDRKPGRARITGSPPGRAITAHPPRS